MDPGEIPSELPQLSQVEEMLIAQLPLVVSSCVFFTINLSEDGTLRKLTRNNNIQNNDDASIRTEESHLQIYWERPSIFEEYDLLGKPIDNEENWKSDNDEYEELEEEDNTLLQEPWMRITTRGLEATTDDLGERFIDINHRWSGSYDAFPNLSDAELFLEQAKRVRRSNNKKWGSTVVGSEGIRPTIYETKK
ncbi:2611_t:CDS:2 [Gigaspora margarita]|uniref:2611_t:CDS:1 n=1 Tax=Gigaspora margarita TaxID=4874 RepID=A0ABN7UGY6_GIGMA|nr:2611_t:CDS:2 [Gigaspora margarita]